METQKAKKTAATTATTATKMARKMVLKFKYEDFLNNDIPNLMINIWSYSDDHGVVCNICTTYKKVLHRSIKKKWQPELKNVDEIIQKLKKRDTKWCNLSKISSAEGHLLMYVIEKDD